MDERKIIHVDMDAFFAAVEQRDNPELRGRPVAVGSDQERGVVSTASYEARAFGVHSAQSVIRAKMLCPQLIIVPVRHEYYQMVSQQIRDIFEDYTDLIEPLSIDEAFLDVTQNKKGMESAVEIALEIKQRIRDELQLTASAGVSYNKFLAKIASDYRKPDGLFVITKDDAEEFIRALQVEKLWGVGPKTAERMRYMGIYTGGQLREVSEKHLLSVFGKAGSLYYNFAHGIDDRPVTPCRIRKSVSCERTFAEDISLPSATIIALYHTVLELVERIKKAKFEGYTLTLKVKYADFSVITKSSSSPNPLCKKADILPLAKALLAQTPYSFNQPIRLMGLSVSNPKPQADKNKRPIWVEGTLEFEQ